MLLSRNGIGVWSGYSSYEQVDISGQSEEFKRRGLIANVGVSR